MLPRWKKCSLENNGNHRHYTEINIQHHDIDWKHAVHDDDINSILISDDNNIDSANRTGYHSSLCSFSIRYKFYIFEWK